MTKKLSQSYIQRKLGKIGFVAKSEYISAKAPLEVQCPHGHINITTWDSARQGQCKYCANNIRMGIEKYILLGRERGIEFSDSRPPQNNNDKVKWKCTQGHEFLNDYVGIAKSKKSSCPFCNGRHKLGEFHYHRLSGTIGVEWLGPLPETTHEKTNWKCKNGHIFTTSYQSVRHKGTFSGCKECSRIAHTGKGHPRYKGTAGLSKYLSRLRREQRILETSANDMLTYQEWRTAKKYFRQRCAYCGSLPATLEKDHFIPICLGGRHTRHNILPACRSCNAQKRISEPYKWIGEKFGKKATRIISKIENYFSLMGQLELLT